jgi:hypothetical protein
MSLRSSPSAQFVLKMQLSNILGGIFIFRSLTNPEPNPGSFHQLCNPVVVLRDGNDGPLGQRSSASSAGRGSSIIL